MPNENEIKQAEPKPPVIGGEFNEKKEELFVVNNYHRRIQNIQARNIATSSKKFLKLSPDFYLSGVLKADATVTSVDGDPGTEATLNSYTIPLNSISRNYTGSGTTGKEFRHAGNVFRIWVAGRYSTDDPTATVAIKCKIGSTTYHTFTTAGAIATNAEWYVKWTVIVPTIGSSGTAESFADFTSKELSTSSQTLDTTAAQTISITATWTSGSAGDDISIRQFIVELIN